MKGYRGGGNLIITVRHPSLILVQRLVHADLDLTLTWFVEQQCSPKQAYQFCSAADTQGEWYKEYAAASAIMQTQKISIHRGDSEQLLLDASHGYSEDLIQRTEAVGSCWQRCSESVSSISNTYVAVFDNTPA